MTGTEPRETVSALFTWRSYIARETEDNDLTSTERLVAHTLAAFMNEAGDSCFPGIDRLARKSALSRRAVQKALRALEEKGALEVDLYGGRNGQGRGRTNHYRAAFGRNETSPPKKGERGSPFTEKANVVPKKGERGSPDVVITTPEGEEANAPSPRPASPSAGKAARRDGLVDALCSALSTPWDGLTRSRQKRYAQVAAELLEAGATPDEVVDRCARWGDLWRAGRQGGDPPRLTLDSIPKWWADLAAVDQERKAGGKPSPADRKRGALKWATAKGQQFAPDDFQAVLEDHYKDLSPEDLHEVLEAYHAHRKEAA